MYHNDQWDKMIEIMIKNSSYDVCCDYRGCNQKQISYSSEFDTGMCPPKWGSVGIYDDELSDQYHYCPYHKNFFCIDDHVKGLSGCGNKIDKNNICIDSTCQLYVPYETTKKYKEEYKDIWKKKSSYLVRVKCDHPFCETKSEDEYPIDTDVSPPRWGSAGLGISDPDDQFHYCPEHKNNYCLDNDTIDIDGCGFRLSDYGECNTAWCERRGLSDEQIEKQYKDLWNKKEAINYFSLDQPNESIMPGMAQTQVTNGATIDDASLDDGLGFGSVGNPDSGMEDNVTQGFPGMHDYERGLSSAASKFNKISYYERIIHCDGCDKRSPYENEDLPRGWAKASGANAGTAEYNHNNDEHYCEDCKKDRCLDEWAGYTMKNIGCGNKIGKYGQCTVCDRTDDQYVQEYKDIWNKTSYYEKITYKNKKNSKKITASLAVKCDSCDRIEEIPYTGFNYNYFYDKGWDGTSDDQGPHFCPDCMENKCPDCFGELNKDMCDSCDYEGNR